MPVVKIDKKDLPRLIDNIERNGGNASQLRALLDSPSSQISPDDLPDNDLVEMMRQDSPVEEGADLICPICHEACSRLTSGTCDSCFEQWALSAKKGYLAARRNHGG